MSLRGPWPSMACGIPCLHAAKADTASPQPVGGVEPSLSPPTTSRPLLVQKAARETAHLLQVPTPRDAANSHGGPTNFRHKLSETAVCAGATRALIDFQDIHHPLGRDALDAVAADFAVQSFQRQSPGIAATGSGAIPCLLQSLKKRHPVSSPNC